MHTDIANALIDVEASTESTFKNESNQFTTLATNTINMMEMPITTRAPNTISMPLFSFTGDLITYYIPFITFAGTIGNVLSVLVFVRSKLKKLSSSYYLAALSISDTGYLLCNFAQWINTWNINIYNRDGFCQLFTFLSSMCTAFSAWLVVAFTVERFIVVRYPLKRQTMCTVRRAKCVLIVLLLLSIVHCAPLLRISEARHDKQYNEMTCDIRPSTKALSQFYNNYDTVVAFLVPALLIVMLNTVTAYTAWKLAGVRRTMTNHKRKKTSDGSNLSVSQKMRRDMESTEDMARTSSCRHLNGNHSAKQSCPQTSRQRISTASQTKVTKMLLIVSSIFVLLNSPSYYFRIMAYLVPDHEKNYSQPTMIAQYITQQLFLTNFGINFLLYCMSGQNFRKELLQWFRSSRQYEGGQQATPGTAMGTGSSDKYKKKTLPRNVSWDDAYELRSTTIPIQK